MVTNVIITPAEDVEIVSLGTVKQHLRLEADYTDEDDLLQAYIDSAIEASENYTNGSITKKTLVIDMDKFENPVVFEAFPLRSIESVDYYPVDGDQLDMDPALYKLTTVDSKVWKLRFLDTLPDTDIRFDAVTVTIETGYEAADVPKPVISAILLQVGDLYERREDRGETLSTAAMALLRPYKKF